MWVRQLQEILDHCMMTSLIPRLSTIREMCVESLGMRLHDDNFPDNLWNLLERELRSPTHWERNSNLCGGMKTTSTASGTRTWRPKELTSVIVMSAEAWRVLAGGGVATPPTTSTPTTAWASDARRHEVLIGLWVEPRNIVPATWCRDTVVSVHQGHNYTGFVKWPTSHKTTISGTGSNGLACI